MTERQLRCPACNRRLADYVNGVMAGTALIEVKCPKCGESARITLTPAVIPPSASERLQPASAVERHVQETAHGDL